MTHEIPEQPGEAGWYTDPDGNYQHQQYWDGERWTGDYRRDPATFPQQRGRAGVVIWLVAIVGGFLAGIAVVALLMYTGITATLGPGTTGVVGLIHIATWVLVGSLIVKVGRAFKGTPGEG